MPLILLMYVLLLSGMLIHPDPLIGMMIECGVLYAIGIPVFFILHVINKRQVSNNKLKSDLEWRRKYPNTRSLKEFMDELDKSDE